MNIQIGRSNLQCLNLDAVEQVAELGAFPMCEIARKNHFHEPLLAVQNPTLHDTHPLVTFHSETLFPGLRIMADFCIGGSYGSIWDFLVRRHRESSLH